MKAQCRIHCVQLGDIISFIPSKDGEYSPIAAGEKFRVFAINRDKETFNAFEWGVKSDDNGVIHYIDYPMTQVNLHYFRRKFGSAETFDESYIEFYSE